MAFNPSKEQSDVISSINQNLIVSAGAGSGKTATLSEKVYRLVKDGNKINRFLVLTFTNAAANEMKNRIRDKLSNDPGTLNQSLLVDNAHIETFDSFALYLVKKYCKELGLSQSINIIDANVLLIKRHKICDDIFEKLYESKDPIFLSYIKNNCIKNDLNVRNLVLDFSSFARRQIDKNSFLDTYVDTYYNEDIIRSYIKEYYDEVIEYTKGIISLLDSIEGADNKNAWRGALNNILNARDFNSLQDVLRFYGENNMPRTSHIGDAKNYDFSKVLNTLKNKYLINVNKSPEYGNEDDVIKDYMSQKDSISLIIDIVKKLEEETDKFQYESQCFSFADIQSLALKILSNEKIRNEIKDSFDFIMVDEYQDTSDIQDSVINLLSKDNTMVVGDVKQSIYRFRNANCDNFLKRYDNYSKKLGGKKIDMNLSHRSRKEIVDFVNDFFSKTMNKNTNPIDYLNGHIFGFGNLEYNNNIEQGIDYRPSIIKNSPDENQNIFESEIELIAHDIIDKINSGYKFMHRKKDGSFSFDSATFSDFAIIVDKGTEFDKVANILGKYRLPLNVVNDEKIQDTDVTIVLRNVLKALPNLETNDVKTKLCLWALNRSFITEYSDDDIYKMNKDATLYSNDVYQKLVAIKEESYHKSLYELFSTIFEKFDVFEKVSKLNGYIKNYHIAEYFLSLARNMDDMGFGIEGAIQYFEDIHKIDNCSIDYRDLDVRKDSITLINIHKSKGLEYGYVYYPGFDHTFYVPSSNGNIFSNKYGMVFKYPKSMKHASLAYHLAERDEKKATFYEKLRLLYVAITRAKEGFSIIFSEKVKKNNKKVMRGEMIDYSSFKKLFEFYSDELSTIRYSTIDMQNSSSLNINEIDLAERNFKLEKIVPMSEEEIVKNRASKIIPIASSSLLDFGSLVHSAIEATNFDNKDTSFIDDKTVRKYVDNVLKSRLFAGIFEKNIKKEFPFYDEKNNTFGFIDCLIEKDNEIIIVDFKFKDLDDDAYVTQLHAYKQYISTLSDKNIKMFLLSYLTGEEKEIL